MSLKGLEQVSSPLSSPVETSWTSTEVASIGVGAAVDTRVVACATFIYILASWSALLIFKTRWTHTLKAAQCVVAGGRATHWCSLTLVLIWRGRRRELDGKHVEMSTTCLATGDWMMIKEKMPSDSELINKIHNNNKVSLCQFSYCFDPKGAEKISKSGRLFLK